MPEQTRRAYEFGPFSLDPDRRVVLRGGQVVPLTAKAFDILLVLIENRSRVVDKDELLKLIWPDTVVEERNVAVNISTLRKVLGDSLESHEYIVTLPGRGYRFVAPLRESQGRVANQKAGTGDCGPGANDPGARATEARLPRGRAVAWSRKGLLAAGVLGGLIGAFALGQYWARRSSSPVMRFSTISNFSGVETQPAFSPDGRSVAFVSDRGGHSDLWVGLPGGGNLVRVTNDPNVKARPRWSPDASKLLYARLNESGLWDSWVVPALGGPARVLTTNAADPTWFPDGRSIAYANLSTGAIWMCDADGRNARAFTTPDPDVRHRQPAFSRDGRLLAFVRKGAAGPYGQLAVAEVDTRKTRLLTDAAAFVASPVWSAEGKFVYFASGRGGAINIWKVDARGERTEQITVGRGDDTDLDISADGRRIVFSSYRVSVNLEEIVLGVRDARTNRFTERKWLTSDSARTKVAPVYSRDGTHIAYFTNRRGAEREAIWAMAADGTNPAPLAYDERMNMHARWSADGESVVYSSRTGIGPFGWRNELRRTLLSGGVPHDIPFPISDYFGDVGPRDQLLYRATNGSVQVFDQKSNQVQTLKNVEGTFLRWSPDGRRFAAVVNARKLNDAATGVWVYDLLDGKRQQVFHGWAAYYAWSGAQELLVIEVKPDLNGILWRVRWDGSPPLNTGSVRVLYSFWHPSPRVQFDLHPDGRRIVIEAFDLHQADISMIDNIR
jgi:Tol biopolymer transport system component/DNA-binding winged helix-turn-helix (wHTH) protein